MPARASAQTETRTVAVIEATAAPTSDAEVTALAAAIEEQLEREDDLSIITSDRRPALLGAIPDGARAPLAEARAALARARDALARFDHRVVIETADAAMTRAVDVEPGDEILGLVADLALARGLAQLGDGAAPDARRSFALVHRLSPGRTLDPARYLPEVVDAFAAAAETGKMTSLDVVAREGAEVWVDGASVGAAPATVTVAPGLHCVTITGERLMPRGQIVDVAASGTKVTIEVAEATPTTVLHRLRVRLVAATDDVERTVVIDEIRRLVGGQDAIIVSRDADGGIVTRIYSGRSGTLGDARPAKDVKPEAIVKPLRPIKLPPRGGGNGGDGPVTPPIVEGPAWYEKRWVQVSIGGTVVAGIIASTVYALTRPQGSSDIDGLMFAGSDSP